MPRFHDADLVLYEFISVFFPLFYCLSLSSLERLIKVRAMLLVLTPLHRCFIYSPSGGARIHLYVEGEF